MSMNGTEIGDSQKLETFRSVLSMFEGRRPFHNFIGSPGQYSRYRRDKRMNQWEELDEYEDEETTEKKYELMEELIFSDDEPAIWIEDHKVLHPRYHLSGSHFRYIQNF